MARKLAFDKTLFAAGIGLSLFGLVMIYSSSAVIAMERFGSAHYFLARQAVAWTIGIAAMCVAMQIDYRRLLKKPVVYLLLLGSTGLLILVLAVDQSHQVHRWVKLGPIQMQPSEIAKLALVVYLAYQLSRKEGSINDLVCTILPYAVVVGE